MTVSTEIARIRTLIDELAAGVASDRRSRQPMSDTDRRKLRSEVDIVMQKLDDLRQQLG